MSLLPLSYALMYLVSKMNYRWWLIVFAACLFDEREGVVCLGTSGMGKRKYLLNIIVYGTERPIKSSSKIFTISNMQSAIAKDTTEYKTQHTSISSILEDLFLVVCFTCIVCRTHMCMCIAVSLGNLYLYTLRYLCIIPSSQWSSIKWIGRNVLRYSGIFEYRYDKNFLY